MSLELQEEYVRKAIEQYHYKDKSEKHYSYRYGKMLKWQTEEWFEICGDILQLWRESRQWYLGYVRCGKRKFWRRKWIEDERNKRKT